MLFNRRYVSVAFNESRLRERNGVLSILLDVSNFSSTSVNPNDLLPGAIAKLDEGISGKAAPTKSFIAQHASEIEDKKRAVLLLDQGLKIIICVPLINMDNVVSIMNSATSQMIRLDNSKIDLITTIGNQIAVAINNVRLYEDLKKKSQLLKEKKRWQIFCLPRFARFEGSRHWHLWPRKTHSNKIR